MPIILSSVQWLSFLGPLLVGSNHCTLGTPHKNCHFTNCHLIKVAQILVLVHFSACSLIYPTTPWQCDCPKINNVHYPPSVVLMLWAISVIYTHIYCKELRKPHFKKIKWKEMLVSDSLQIGFPLACWGLLNFLLNISNLTILSRVLILKSHYLRAG